MSHLEKLQTTISDLQNQSKTLNSLTEVYAKAEKTEENYRQNLELFEKLRLQLESYETLLDQKIISISKQNTDSVSALQATNQKIEQAENQIKQTKSELEEQASSIEAHLKEVKSQNKAFYEQTQDLLIQKTDNLNASHEKFYLETTERIQNRLTALTQKNEDFYSSATEGIRKTFSEFTSHTKKRDDDLEKMLVLKVDTIHGENQALFIQANLFSEKLEKTYTHFKNVLDKMAEFQMQFDTIGTNLENQEREIYNQSELLKESQTSLQSTQKNQFDTFSDYQKKALKFIYDNQSQEFKAIKENLENKFELQSDSYNQNQIKLEQEISLQQKNQLVSLQAAQNEAITPIKEIIEEELNLQKSKIDKISTFQIITFVGMLINLALLIYLLIK